MDNPVAVALEIVTVRVRRFRVSAAARTLYIQAQSTQHRW
jgi:hypothetical protein